MTEAAPRLWPAVLAAVGGTTLVGFMPIIALRLYAHGIGAPSMLFWRYAFAILPLVLVAAALGNDLRGLWRSGAWRIGLVGATLGAAQTLCFWESIKTLETSIAVLLFYTYPALTLALERLFFKLPIRPVAVFCIAIILFGAALITGPGLQNGTLDPRGLMWAIPSPLIYALYLVVTTRMLRDRSPLIGAALLYGGMGATFAAAVPFLGLDVPAQIDTWLLLAFIGLGPGALTITSFAYAAPRLGPSSYAIIANMELVTVVAVGVLLLGEPMTPERAIGGALIVAGIVVHGLSRKGTGLRQRSATVRIAAPTRAKGG